VLRQIVVVAIALVVVVGFIRALSFSENPVRRSPERTQRPTNSAFATATGTPSPSAGPNPVAITVTVNRVTVRPRSAVRDHGMLWVRVENHAPYMIEIVFAAGAARRTVASRLARERVVTVGTGEQRQERLSLPAGRYTVAARPLTEGDVPPARAGATALLHVRP
jgi:hypothetical protein